MLDHPKGSPWLIGTIIDPCGPGVQNVEWIIVNTGRVPLHHKIMGGHLFICENHNWLKKNAFEKVIKYSLSTIFTSLAEKGNLSGLSKALEILLVLESRMSGLGTRKK